MTDAAPTPRPDATPVPDPTGADELGVRRVRELLSLLQVEELDRDLYRAGNVSEDERGLYGGTVAGQALRAASHTVDANRIPHSLHGYFLRPGRSQHPTILRVERDRDGRSFSARRVTALQDGKAIFTMAASFHLDEAGGNLQQVPFPHDAEAPEALTDLGPVRPSRLMMEMRDVALPGAEFPTRVWARSRVPLPDDRVLHACVLTYLSDLYTGLSSVLPNGAMGPSLDHALWFHRHIQLDDWVLMDLQPRSVNGVRGLYQGAIFDRHGVLGASIQQEMLLRT